MIWLTFEYDSYCFFFYFYMWAGVLFACTICKPDVHGVKDNGASVTAVTNGGNQLGGYWETS